MRPWSSAGYVHSNSHIYEKLGLRANKCIYIRYSDESKEYVMLREQPVGTITGIASAGTGVGSTSWFVSRDIH